MKHVYVNKETGGELVCSGKFQVLFQVNRSAPVWLDLEAQEELSRLLSANVQACRDQLEREKEKPE